MKATEQYVTEVLFVIQHNYKLLNLWIKTEIRKCDHPKWTRTTSGSRFWVWIKSFGVSCLLFNMLKAV